jgi:hypothetical protein
MSESTFCFALDEGMMVGVGGGGGVSLTWDPKTGDDLVFLIFAVSPLIVTRFIPSITSSSRVKLVVLVKLTLVLYLRRFKT